MRTAIFLFFLWCNVVGVLANPMGNVIWRSLNVVGALTFAALLVVRLIKEEWNVHTTNRN